MFFALLSVLNSGILPVLFIFLDKIILDLGDLLFSQMNLRLLFVYFL